MIIFCSVPDTNCVLYQLVARNRTDRFPTHSVYEGLSAIFNDDEFLPTGQIKMVIVDNLMDRTFDDLMIRRQLAFIY